MIFSRRSGASRSPRRLGRAQHGVEGLEARDAGQAEIEQHARDVELPQRVVQGPGAVEVDRDPGVREELLDEQGVPVVVLHEQDGDGSLVELVIGHVPPFAVGRRSYESEHPSARAAGLRGAR